jgi:CheY-like chemotaxis protein
MAMDTAGARNLIADDDAAARRLLDVRLPALGYDTIMAADGEDALIALRGEPPALVPLDLQMPRMGGMEVLRSLRRDEPQRPDRTRHLLNSRTGELLRTSLRIMESRSSGLNPTR